MDGFKSLDNYFTFNISRARALWSKKSLRSNFSINPKTTSVYPENGSFGSGEHLTHESMKQKYLDSPQVNRGFKTSFGEQTALWIIVVRPSQFSTPSWSLSSNRLHATLMSHIFLPCIILVIKRKSFPYRHQKDGD
jgi:hypothetical protein